MTALKVIGIILLIFILIGFLRVGALMQFGDELRVQLSVGPFRFTLLPAKEKGQNIHRPSLSSLFIYYSKNTLHCKEYNRHG